MKQVHNTRLYRKCVIRKVKKVFTKPSGLKYDYYCQGYIHFSNRGRTKKLATGREKLLTLQKPVQIKKKKNSEY